MLCWALLLLLLLLLPGAGRMHTLLSVSGVLDHTLPLKARPATLEELHRVHDPAYVKSVAEMSKEETKGHHTCGDVATFAPGGYEVASLAAGAAVVAVDAVLDGRCRNAYVLMRPPGHHAERDHGMGFCIFNNVAVAAAHLLGPRGLKKVAVVDFDVHHGNGTQHIFEDDPRVLFISIHQDSNYPLHSGYLHEQGTGPGLGFTVNLPLPPGSGSGAYRAAFDRVAVPALEAFGPEIILVSCGFDAAFLDPLSAMILGAADYGWMIRRLLDTADSLPSCHGAGEGADGEGGGEGGGGRLVALHEGGYSELYVPFCGLKVLEEMTGHKTAVEDPHKDEVASWGYQALQPHQAEVIRKAEEGSLALLKEKMRLASA